MKRDPEKLQALYNDAKHAYVTLGWTKGAYYRDQYGATRNMKQASCACFVGAIAWGGGHDGPAVVNGMLYEAGVDPGSVTTVNDRCETKEQALKEVADLMGIPADMR